MATKDDVIRLHRANPKWTATEIACRLGCMGEYVRATAKRQGLKLTVTRAPNGGSVVALGQRVKALGLATHVDELDALAKRLRRT